MATTARPELRSFLASPDEWASATGAGNGNAADLVDAARARTAP
ncbi:hypothetical protein [Streptomyces sp. ISL-100]|nr:hypothetical protein [Streptomyces sp. ISL-100]